MSHDRRALKWRGDRDRRHRTMAAPCFGRLPERIFALLSMRFRYHHHICTPGSFVSCPVIWPPCRFVRLGAQGPGDQGMSRLRAPRALPLHPRRMLVQAAQRAVSLFREAENEAGGLPRSGNHLPFGSQDQRLAGKRSKANQGWLQGEPTRDTR